MVGFADDTTQATTRKDQPEAESRMLQVLAESGMTAHPEKLERLAISQEDPKKKLGKGWEDHVRFLGCILSSNGGTTHDTDHRLQAAKAIWRKRNRQLPRLGISLKMRGRVTLATVYASLLYGCESRDFAKEDFNRYRGFLGRVLRSAFYHPTQG